MTTKIRPISSEIFEVFETQDVEGNRNFVYEFLGTRTRTAYRGDNSLGGRQKAKQLDSWEWIPLLWAVATARDSVTLVELGAGWGPWISNGYVASRLLGFENIKIYGVEAEPAHFEYLKTHLSDNGIKEEDTELVSGLIAATSGVALFPITKTPEKSWGLRKVGREGTDRDAILASVGAEPIPGKPGRYSLPKNPHEFYLQQTISLEDLIAPSSRIDFMHVDIQGSEGEVVDQSIGVLNEKCRCVAIGTHSHEIEDQLREIFNGYAWACHHDSTMHHTDAGRLVDGHQVWVNPRFN